MTVEKPKLWRITKGAINAMNQSEYLTITWNLLKAQEKSRVQGSIGFGFAYNWLKNLRKTFKPITKGSNHYRVITFDSHLKTLQKLLLQLLLIIFKQFQCIIKWRKLLKTLNRSPILWLHFCLYVILASFIRSCGCQRPEIDFECERFRRRVASSLVFRFLFFVLFFCLFVCFFVVFCFVLLPILKPF